MEKNTEYHDPDYPEVTASTSDERPKLTKEQKVNKIKVIVDREFTNEIGYKEGELNLIDERVTGARRMLHQLRYLLVRQYYDKPLSAAQIQDDIASQYEPRAKAEVSSILNNSQKRIHPSVKKLLGKNTVDLEEIFRFRSPRNKTKKNYVAMIQAKNVTVKEDSLQSLRPESNHEPSPEPIEMVSKLPKKLPRTILPKSNKVLSLNEATRNKQKHRYRVIIGNTSKYAPSCSSVDRSTHKWLLYIRGPPRAPDLSAVVSSVTITLHHTYAPHHMLTIDKPPFHVSRRGWGEFPAKIELHFCLPDINPPVTLEHTIKLDRNYTGLQTMGCETLADVWLYSNEQMLQYEFKDEDNDTQCHTVKEDDSQMSQLLTKEIKKENIDNDHETENTWMDFFTKNPAELNVDDMIIKHEKQDPEKDPLALEVDGKTESPQKRLMKYMNPTTGKIFYLEVDFDLDISKVQEIIINSKGNKRTAKISPNKNGIGKEKTKSPLKKENSLLKPEVKSEIIRKNKTEHDFSHIENDHCYILPPKSIQKSKVAAAVPNEKLDDLKSSHYYDKLCKDVSSMTCVRTAVNYLLRKIPIICDKYCQIFPFVVNNEKKYWTLDFVKRRNVEWSRAKFINKMLTENFTHEPIWRTKQILLFSRLHGYNPVKPDTYFDQDFDLNTTAEAYSSNLKDRYPKATDISTLSLFKDGDFLQNGVNDEIDLTVDENVDVVSFECSIPPRLISPMKCNPLPALPYPDEETRLRHLYIERTCGTLGILLTNEDVGSGHCYSAVHAVLLSAMQQFAEEMIRKALAVKLTDMKRRTQAAAALPTLPVWDSAQSSPLPLIELEHVVRAAPTSRTRVITGRRSAARATTYTTV